MAPEQVSGDPVGPAADVWALGVVLYECLTGRTPFCADSAGETMRLVRSAEPIPPRRLRPGVPLDLDAICMKCLRKDPAQRYGGARDLAQDLRCFLSRKPVGARPARRWDRAWQWARGRPTKAVLWAFALGLALGGIAQAAALLLSRLAG
jgi:serine/threonine-protein kinase